MTGSESVFTVWASGCSHVIADHKNGRESLGDANQANNLCLITAELTSNMFAALCSWTYNLGTGALQRSSLRRLYKRGAMKRRR